MNAFRCLRLAARPCSATTASLRPSIGHLISRSSQRPTTARPLSLLAPRRPILPTTTFHPNPPSTPSATLEFLDLVPKSSISAHPGFQSLQIRCGPRDTYNPSHLVRKRRHGFLARLKSKKGRKLLLRRIKKGRWNLSH
ncbi:hypothetical protein K505DRAFT_297952 [Melanomma pulvis-pyrius CBS 109.77]|uniref:Large ribosomal subunit protein bL34m n=1 Tax=Melanomma pulvis-pyrius CBS 109.77 TaxID=1314802 RepID=A0A6A6XP02_9PLEO|nr:hypothetical protein K505DRAFT_297952 [Melanomma pulvis-pyrius CBS 109.77]